ncbi:hypothetical protein AMEX_G1085 [Astyanax mexicanus]|uniref:Uncharacterized protein n=1 Tax=Astyanax mexicanus TaxID=7994 RepID=A0A8T2MGW9_ASTMX|nr:hypothetical protein AMEX_G1085 [Astyanax mexicanus]
MNSCSIKAGGRYGQYQFINTCVLDSLLVGLCNCHNKNPKFRELFQTDRTLKAIMIFLNANKFNEARYLWLIYLNLLNPNCRFNISEIIDFWSEVEDHLPVFINLVCSKDHFSGEDGVHGMDDILHQSIKSAFQPYGNIMPLGMTYKEPRVILVSKDNGLDTAPPIYVTDTYGRTFKLQFLLVKQKVHEQHMVVCCNMEDRWVLYDNNPDVPPEEVNYNEDFKNDYPVYLACYLNVPQPGHSYGMLILYVADE